MAEEYYSFEKALEELRLKEEDLKRLVSEGEIRAFRAEDKMKFKKADVEKLKAKSGAGDEAKGGVDESAETLADDLIFDEDEDLDLSDDEPGMATEKIASADTLDAFEDEGAVDVVEEEGVELLEESAAAVRRTSGRATRARTKAQASATKQPALLFLLILTALPLLYGIAFIISTARSNDADLTRGFTHFVNSLFGG